MAVPEGVLYFSLTSGGGEAEDGSTTPTHFELRGDQVVRIGRATKNDVQCQSAGVSWHHVEFKLLPPTTSSPSGGAEGSTALRLGIRDISSNGTGLQAPKGPFDRLAKNELVEVKDNSVVALPIRLKAGEQQKVFTVRVGPHARRPPAQAQDVQTSAAGAPVRPAPIAEAAGAGPTEEAPSPTFQRIRAGIDAHDCAQVRAVLAEVEGSDKPMGDEVRAMVTKWLEENEQQDSWDQPRAPSGLRAPAASTNGMPPPPRPSADALQDGGARRDGGAVAGDEVEDEALEAALEAEGRSRRRGEEQEPEEEPAAKRPRRLLPRLASPNEPVQPAAGASAATAAPPSRAAGWPPAAASEGAATARRLPTRGARPKSSAAPPRAEAGEARLPPAVQSSLAKGEAIIRQAREAEDQDQWDQAWDSYNTGLKHMIGEVLPKLPKDSALKATLRRQLSEYLERAERLKEKLDQSKASSRKVSGVRGKRS